MSQLGLVEGVTSESDYGKFIRHCSSIFRSACVCLPATASRVDTVPTSQSFKKARQQKNPWWLYALFLFVSHLLSYFLHAAIGGGSEGERSGVLNSTTAYAIRHTVVSFSCNIQLRKKHKQLVHSEVAASCDSYIRTSSPLCLHCST